MGGFGGNTLLLVGAGATLALDQLTKRLVANWLGDGQPRTLLGSARLMHRTGAGATFLSLSVRQALLVWLFVVVSLQLMVVFDALLQAATAVGIGLVVGGATGNLADRVARGGVVDFVAIGRWPTFNLADAAMVSGLGLATWSLL